MLAWSLAGPGADGEATQKGNDFKIIATGGNPPFAAQQ